jgi:hypothetical protein
MDITRLTVKWRTIATRVLLPVPALASIASHRFWLMALVSDVYMFCVGAYFLYLARRTHLAVGLVGFGFMAGAVFLMGRLALDLYPQ